MIFQCFGIYISSYLKEIHLYGTSVDPVLCLVTDRRTRTEYREMPVVGESQKDDTVGEETEGNVSNPIGLKLETYFL